LTAQVNVSAASGAVLLASNAVAGPVSGTATSVLLSIAGLQYVAAVGFLGTDTVTVRAVTQIASPCR
jgi:hypothetical protein